MESDNSPFQITLVLTKHLYTELMLTQQLPEWLPPPHESVEDILVWTWGQKAWFDSRQLYPGQLQQFVKTYPIRAWLEFRDGALAYDYGNGSLAP